MAIKNLTSKKFFEKFQKFRASYKNKNLTVLNMAIEKITRICAFKMKSIFSL